MKRRNCLGCGEEVHPHHSVYEKMLELLHRGYEIPMFALLWHELCWVEKYSEFLVSCSAEDAAERAESKEESK